MGLWSWPLGASERIPGAEPPVPSPGKHRAPDAERRAAARPPTREGCGPDSPVASRCCRQGWVGR
eukprot:10947109-Alexandrium_andersonii.AAC.1